MNAIYKSTILIMLLASCSPVYFPSMDTTPMFTSKGQAQVMGGLSVGGISGQAAYAITDHLAVASTFVKISGEDAGILENQTLEVSTGYYRNINDRWCFEMWGGLGTGKSYAKQYYYDCFIFCDGTNYVGSAHFSNGFMQTTFGQNRRRFQWSFNSKLNFLSFDKLNVTLDDEIISAGRQSHFAFESTFMMRLLFLRNRIFWTCQAGISAPITSPKFDWLPLKASTGLVFRFDVKKKSK